MPRFVVEMFSGLKMFAVLQEFSLIPTMEKHFWFVCGSQNYCCCVNANSLIFDQGIRTEGSPKFVHGKKCFSFIVLCEVLAF